MKIVLKRITYPIKNALCVAVNIVTSLYNLKEEELIPKQKDFQRQLHEVSPIITDGSERLQIAIKKKES